MVKKPASASRGSRAQTPACRRLHSCSVQAVGLPPSLLAPPFLPGSPCLHRHPCPLTTPASLQLRSSSARPSQVLALSSSSRKSSAVGDVVNLVSVDVQRLTESITYLNGLWLPLIWIIVCFVYLWQVSWAGGRGLGAKPSSSSSSSSSSSPLILSLDAPCRLMLWPKSQARAAFTSPWAGCSPVWPSVSSSVK